MTRLSVNINKVATLRNARGGNVPNVKQFAIDCERFGAEGITVHPRPDERHITRKDAYELKEVVTTEFNIEGYPSEDFLKMVEEIKPTQVTFVPDPPDALTSNAGWDTKKHLDFLKDVVSRMHEHNIRTSIFIETEESLFEFAAQTGTDRIELYTEPFASNFEKDKEQAVHAFTLAAKKAYECGLGVNAGHDLSLANLKFFKQQVPHLLEVSIGHALISDALYLGIENTIQLYKRQLA